VLTDWEDGDHGASAFRLERTRKTLTLPAGRAALRDSMRWSPSGMRLAFATRAADPCSADPDKRRAALYVAEAATGRLRELAAGEGPLEPAWLGDSRLAFVDRAGGGPAVRVRDVDAETEAARLVTAGGVTTGLLAAPACAAGPPPDPEEAAAASPTDEEADAGVR
jgi:hypothetical protein